MRSLVLTMLVGLLILTACSGPKNKLEKCHKPQEFQTAKVGPRVRIPDDLEPLKAEDRLAIPYGPTKTEPTPQGQPCLIEPPEYLERAED